MPPACLVAAGWSLGVGLAAVAPAEPALGFLAAACGLIAGSAAVLVRPIVVPIAVAAACLGVARAELVNQPAPPAPVIYTGRAVALEGRVIDDPRPAGSGLELLVAADAALVDGQPANGLGNLLLQVKQGSRAGYGDEVTAAGRLRLPPERPGFDRRAYLLQRGVRFEVQAVQLTVNRGGDGVHKVPGAVRRWYQQTVATLMPAPYDALLTAIVLGVKQGIPRDLQTALIATGLIHLLVLSGLKVAVFARLVCAALAPALGRLALWPALALVAGYAIVGGATPAAVRAATMGALALYARQSARSTHVWTSLALVAGAMLGWHPELAWDVGFQLSFAGTGAIILLTPPLERRLGFLPRLVREPLAVTTAAQVGTLPLMATDFHLVSPVAPLANALTLPLLPVLVGAGLLLAPINLVPLLARPLAVGLSALLAYIQQVAGFCAGLPLAAIPIPSFPASAGLAYYAAVGGSLLAARAHGRTRLAGAALAALVPVIIAGAELVGWAWSGQSVSVLAVGDGQAVLLSGPQGDVLVDGGSSPTVLAGELGQRMAPWRRTLTALAITAPTRGHVGGLAGFAYSAQAILMPDTSLQGSAWRNAAWGAVARGAQPERLVAGQRLQVAGFVLQILAPEPGDPGGQLGAGYLAFRAVAAGGTSFCDLSDLDPESQVAVAARLPGRCDYLLLPAGGASAPAAELIQAARPRELIASTASGRIARELGSFMVRRTDQEGTIVLDL